jgi:molecular chaperone DnaK
MVRDAQEHAVEDKQRRDEVEVRNQAEQLTYQAERTIGDLGDKVSPEDKAEVEREVATVREALKGSDIAAVRTGMEALTGTLSRVATAAYARSASSDGSDGTDGTGGAGSDGTGSADGTGEGEPAGAGTRSGGADGAPDETVEGEFKEV